MLQLLTTGAFNRVASLVLLTLMVLALIASPSAASWLQDASPPAAGADPAVPLRGDHDFRHEGE